MTIGIVRPTLGLPCSRRSRRHRTEADLYRLVLPDGWTLDELEPWRSRG